MTVYKNSCASLINGECPDALKDIEDNSIDAVVTDPPYALTSIVNRFGKTSVGDHTQTSSRARSGADGYARLSRGFMGESWDSSIPDVEIWLEIKRVLKPGAWMAAFGGTRTWHRLAVNIEDSGFEIRDSIAWLHAQGFPKSYDISKGIDKKLGVKRETIEVPNNHCGVFKHAGDGREQDHKDYTKTISFAESDLAKKWDGWGTALSPSHEPIILARNPLYKSNVDNVIEYGVGGLNIDGSRIESNDKYQINEFDKGASYFGGNSGAEFTSKTESARWPKNVITDSMVNISMGETGGYFFCPKPNGDEKNNGLEDENTHPTVKPITLMAYLIRLLTPDNGIVLDPFMGSGTTGVAAIRNNYQFTGVEMVPDYYQIAQKRIDYEINNKQLLLF